MELVATEGFHFNSEAGDGTRIGGCPVRALPFRFRGSALKLNKWEAQIYGSAVALCLWLPIVQHCTTPKGIHRGVPL